MKATDSITTAASPVCDKLHGPNGSRLMRDVFAWINGQFACADEGLKNWDEFGDLVPIKFHAIVNVEVRTADKDVI